MLILRDSRKIVMLDFKAFGRETQANNIKKMQVFKVNIVSIL